MLLLDCTCRLKHKSYCSTWRRDKPGRADAMLARQTRLVTALFQRLSRVCRMAASSARSKLLLLFDVDGTVTPPRLQVSQEMEQFLYTQVS